MVERAKRATVVGHQPDRHDLAGVGVGQVFGQRRPGQQTVGFADRELDGADRVVLVGGR